MIAKLTRVGSRWALVLDSLLLESTGIDEETPIEISTDGDVIVISPQRDPERTESLRAGMERIHGRFAGVFRRLAE